MASKETSPSGSGSQESGNSSRTPWDTLGEFVHRIGNSFRDDDSRHIDLPTPDSGMSNSFTKGGQDGTTAQETSGPESDEEDKKSPKTPTLEDVARAKIAELEEILIDSCSPLLSLGLPSPAQHHSPKLSPPAKQSRHRQRRLKYLT